MSTFSCERMQRELARYDAFGEWILLDVMWLDQMTWLTIGSTHNLKWRLV
jgi:hypothetical protein